MVCRCRHALAIRLLLNIITIYHAFHHGYRCHYLSPPYYFHAEYAGNIAAFSSRRYTALHLQFSRSRCHCCWSLGLHYQATLAPQEYPRQHWLFGGYILSLSHCYLLLLPAFAFSQTYILHITHLPSFSPLPYVITRSDAINAHTSDWLLYCQRRLLFPLISSPSLPVALLLFVLPFTHCLSPRNAVCCYHQYGHYYYYHYAAAEYIEY